MNIKYKYKVCIMDCFVLLVLIQLSRMLIKYILLSQFSFTIMNLYIINMISFILVGVSLSLILKQNELYNPMSQKLVNMMNTNNDLLRLILKVITAIVIITAPFFNGGYTLSNIIPLVSSVIIIPIFEELLFREYLWNYLNNYIKKGNVVLIVTAILFGIYHLGYVDIIYQHIVLTNKQFYILDIMFFKIIIGLIYGGVLGFIKLKFKDTYICILIHMLINVFWG